MYECFVVICATLVFRFCLFLFNVLYVFFFFFFFSSRRRHTRSTCDWSSDVCSSDLFGLTESGLDRVIRTTYDLLGYMSFFTVGEDECRAWSIARGTPAQLAAGEIHTDIQRGFIRAEVVSYDALIARGSMQVCREHGEVRLEGKEYIVQDGDIINFRHAT